MKVIGAGFSRTGTLSLKLALESLGVGRCLHPLDPIGRSVAVAGHVTGLAGLGATVGSIGARHYPELMRSFPEAKVVLTVRDPEAWLASYASCARTTRELALQGGSRLLAAEAAANHALMLEGGPIWSEILAGDIAERERALALYERHNQTVIDTVPSERLLVYDVAQGWAPLCDLLDVPVPDRPFPRVNTSASFRSHLPLADDAEEPVPERPSSLAHGHGARLGALAVLDPVTSLDQDQALRALELDGDEFAQGVFERCGVARRDLHIGPEMLDHTLQGRTEQVE
ncbi:MAG TPA: sulfotransferase, partial [Solirubrobacteraceae bacterium]|nr:sulfotransferase [Solirubrobacteraceae bacterium]